MITPFDHLYVKYVAGSPKSLSSWEVVSSSSRKVVRMYSVRLRKFWKKSEELEIKVDCEQFLKVKRSTIREWARSLRKGLLVLTMIKMTTISRDWFYRKEKLIIKMSFKKKLSITHEHNRLVCMKLFQITFGQSPVEF